jgi:hypothetical protein
LDPHDQGEADIVCDRVGVYACLERQLVSSYRAQFNSTPLPFISIQLPGYTDGVFAMRLEQDKASAAIPNAAVVATYDDSCAFGKTDGCPHGNVHNVHKQTVGYRVALKIRNMSLGEKLVTEGPRAVHAAVVGKYLEQGQGREGDGSTATGYSVSVTFVGGTGPFYFAGTRNCTSCCGGGGSGGSGGSNGNTDFDTSSSGGSNSSAWVNGTDATVSTATGGATVTFMVAASSDASDNASAAPTWVRYTANAVFPQCALYNQEGLPAMPFEMGFD